VQLEAPLPPDAREALETAVREINEAHAAAAALPARREVPPPLEAVEVQRLFEALQNPMPLERILPKGPRVFYFWEPVRRALERFLEHPALGPLHAVRLLILTGVLHPGSDYDRKYGLMEEADRLLTYYRSHHSPPLNLRLLAAVFEAVGADGRSLGRYWLRHSRWRSKPFPWAGEVVWHYFAERLDLLEAAFAPDSDSHRRLRAFQVLETFPWPPAPLTATLWQIALGTSKKERPLAQACLARAPDRTERTLAGLESPKAETRAAAAEWLGRQSAPDAIGPLQAALAREKQDSAREAMLDALEALGVSLDPYLDPEALFREASDGLAAVKSGTLEWFPFEGLPRLVWSDTGAEVVPDIVKWLIVQSHRFKSPEPGALLRRYCARFEPIGRESLGLYVLDAWMARDTSTVSRAEAEAWAAERLRHHSGYPHYESLRQKLVARVLSKPVGSATAERGVLAVAAAAAGGSVAPRVKRYLTAWPKRAAQCRALVRMLAAIDHPAATQLLLSVATRFRSKSVQAEAKTLSDRLAEEKGWTVEELEDRAIPTGGFEEDGVLVLDYGPRKFFARLGASERIELSDESGSALRALPAAGKSDDPETATRARKALKDARRDLQAVVIQQKARLYEALCNERRWTLADWEAQLLRHPLVGRLCRRLVWRDFRDPASVELFRPLEDGSLTDLEDRRVRLEGSTPIGIAHACHVDPERARAWLAHFADYALEPLFDQFGRPAFRLSADKREATEVADFEGHVIDSLALARRAEGLGYLRGPFEGHTWFQLYRKPFSRVGVEALIWFSGNDLHENHPVALRKLSFARLDPELRSSHPAAELALGEVPPVLLSECWNDLRTLAEAGSGYDPEWKAEME
jgi:hypothetical protein